MNPLKKLHIAAAYDKWSVLEWAVKSPAAQPTPEVIRVIGSDGVDCIIFDHEFHRSPRREMERTLQLTSTNYDPQLMVEADFRVGQAFFLEKSRYAIEMASKRYET